MDCTQARDEFSALLDGELAPEERAAVESHLSLCSDCLRELDGLKRVDVFYRQLPSVKAPEGFEEGVRQGLRTRVLLRFPRRRPVWPYLAAAAGFLLVLGVAFVQFALPGSGHMRMAAVPQAESAPAPPAMDAVAAEPGPRRRVEDRAQDDALAEGPEMDAPVAQKEAAERAFRLDAPETPPASPSAVEGGRVIAWAAPEALDESPEGNKPAAPQAGMGDGLLTPPGAEAETLEFYDTREQQAGSLAPAPPSATARGELAQTTEEPGAAPRKIIGPRTFVLRRGVWVQDGYDGEEETTRLVRGSLGLREIVARHPDLAPALDLGEHIVFKADGRWYRIAPRPEG